MTRNQLASETSPYLLQHKDNPVHWFPWGPEALAAAKSENKPILLSVGYAACHWCHVMAHESFENDAIAAQMNADFINVKVDREERPDIDAIYMTALHALGQQGGWPLTMFLTPDGEPFWGGTYFPPTPRHGQPGFPQVLTEIARLYQEEPEKVEGNRSALLRHLAHLPDTKAHVQPELLVMTAPALMRVMDPINGGLQGAPKFPQTGLLELLWRAHLQSGEAAFRETVTRALTHMAQGGIYDHLGGGYARYAVDDRWLAPHFEKMLYDNALLISLMTEVWRDTADTLLKTRCEETLDWLAREMTTSEGAFAASLDADSEGEEGRFYVWSKPEIADLLGDAAAQFSDAYDVTDSGNWEGKTILNRLAQADAPFDLDAHNALAPARATLMTARARRVRPGLDDKVLADWNGLMIRALARAGFIFNRPDWVESAATAFRFVTESMVRDKRLFHAYREGRVQHRALSDDLANMAAAAIALFEVTRDWTYVDQAQTWITELDAFYWNEQGGAYYFTASDAEALITRTFTAQDDATPAANGTLPATLIQLYALSGDEHYRQRADQLIEAFGGAVLENAFPYGSWINSFDTAVNLTQIVLVGNAGSQDHQALLDVLRTTSLPTGLLIQLSPDEELPSGHPAAGKPMREGKATAYICTGPVCSPPVTDPQDFRVALHAARAIPADPE